MQPPPIFIDVTTTLMWGDRTAVGIVRVEHYLIRHLLERHRGRVGFAVFDKPSACFRSASQDEAVHVLQFVYGEEDAREGQRASGASRLKSLGFTEAKALSGHYFESRLKKRMDAAGLPAALTRTSNAVFQNAVGVASLAAKPFVRAHDAVGGAAPSPWDRVLVPIEPYRDRRAFESAWLVMAGLTWDYMSYPHLHALADRSRLKVAHIVYDTIPVDFPQYVPHAGHVYHRHFVEIAQTGSAFFAISNYSADRFTKTIFEPNLIEKTIASHGLPNFLAAAAEKQSKPIPQLTGKRFAVFCSTIEARKNHMLLLNIWQRLLQERPAEVVPHLVFIGKWGWAFEAVKNQIELNPVLRNRVKVLDGISDASLIWLYENADFTLFPSFCEGWGLAASESLTFGTPVVMSTAPSLDEAAQGLMPRLDPYDFTAWYETVGGLVDDASKLNTLRAKAATFKPVPEDSFGAKLVDLMLERKAA